MYRNPWPVEGKFASITTSAVTGTDFVAFTDYPCNALAIVNNNAVTIEVRRFGAGTVMRVLAGASYLVTGITNQDQVSGRRTDNSTTPVTIDADAFRY